MRFVGAVCCQFGTTREHVAPGQQSKIRVTGCPVRADIRDLPPGEAASKRLGLDLRAEHAGHHRRIARRARPSTKPCSNRSGVDAPGLADSAFIGQRPRDIVRDGYRELARSRLPWWISRPRWRTSGRWRTWRSVAHGASTCAELTDCGVASILMPYPFHKDMHQRANAKVLADAGAAVLMDDEKDAKKNAARLTPAIQSLLYDAERRRAMSAAAQFAGQARCGRGGCFGHRRADRWPMN